MIIHIAWRLVHARDPPDVAGVVPSYGGLRHGVGRELERARGDLLRHNLAVVARGTAAQVSFADREEQGLSVSDRRGVTPLIYQHVSPYGVFDLDLTTRLPLREPVLAA